MSRNSGQRYRQSDFDYLALYVVPKDVWYIIPMAVAAWRATIEVCPGYKRNQYECYREAWHLLREGDGAAAKGQRGVTIHAMQAVIENYAPLPTCYREWREVHEVKFLRSVHRRKTPAQAELGRGTRADSF